MRYLFSKPEKQSSIDEKGREFVCCRVTVAGIGSRAREILRMTGFTGGKNTGWARELEDKTWVTATFDNNRIVLNVHPPVSHIGDHSRQRLAAALMFKVATFLAEDAGCKLVQEASVAQCLKERGKSSILIASYPQAPLRFENVCPGFREVFIHHPSPPPEPSEHS